MQKVSKNPTQAYPAASTSMLPVLPVMVVLLVTILMARGVARAQTASGTGSTKVAIANPVRIFSELQQTKDLVEDLKSKGKTIQAESLKRDGEIKDLQQKRDTLRPDTSQWVQLNDQLTQKKIEAQSWSQYTNESMLQQQKQQIMTLYNKITAAAAKVAAQRGIDLVIAEQKPEIPADITPVNIDQLRDLLGRRNVLYSTEAVDISSQIIALMDADYKTGK